MKKYSVLVCILILFSCDKNEEIIDFHNNSLILESTGSFIFNQYIPLQEKPIEVFYHIPLNSTNNTEILFVLHGSGRNGKDLRDQLIIQANLLSFIIICPVFDNINFDGGDRYNLANIFVDGDNPSPETLNSESVWITSVFDPIFNYFKNASNNIDPEYDLLGFSAGAQLAHRFFLFNQENYCDKVIAMSSGWYTTLDQNINFPYGTQASPFDINSIESLLTQNLTILIGENDTDPNAVGLRHNETVDLQGNNRLNRANYFYNSASNKASESGYNFNWEIITVTNTAHEFLPLATYATEILYQ